MNKTLDEATSIAKIKDKIAQLAALRSLPRSCPEFKKWYRETIVLLERIFGASANQINDFIAIEFTYRGAYTSGDPSPFERRYRSALEEAEAILTSIYEEIEEFGLSVEDSSVKNPISVVEKIALRFHAVARQAPRAARQQGDARRERRI